jgi:hypothetical protein
MTDPANTTPDPEGSANDQSAGSGGLHPDQGGNTTPGETSPRPSTGGDGAAGAGGPAGFGTGT